MVIENLREYFQQAHKHSDVDAERTSLHHTLGTSPNQAAPGNHKHSGDKCKIYRAAATPYGITSGTPTIVPFDSAAYDPQGMYVPSTDNTKIVIKTAGDYLIMGKASHQVGSGSSTVQTRILVNGSIKDIALGICTSILSIRAWCIGQPLAVGDYVQLQVYSSAGGSVAGNGEMETALSLKRMLDA